MFTKEQHIGTESVATGVFTNSWWVRNRYWSVTPNFKNVAKVDLPINEYVTGTHDGSQELWTYSKTDLTTGTTTSVYNGVLWEYNNTFVTRLNEMQATYFPYSEWDEMQNEALLKALVGISDMKVNLEVSLAEAKKTSDLILGSANRIARSIRALRRGNFREVAKQLNLHPRTVHKTWLEYKYGWMPILQEVQGAAEFFAQRFALPQKNIVSATGIVRRTHKGVINNPGSLYYDRLWPLNETWEGTVVCKVELRGELTSPYAAQLQQLGLTNPALVAWELVPFSFVFDWFVSVGDWLQAQTALFGITLKTAMASFVDHSFYEWEQPAIDPIEAGATVHHYGKRTAWDARVQYWRKPISVDPLLVPPRIRGIQNLSFQRLVSGLALIRATTSRRG